jgi:hypothetical protein
MAILLRKYAKIKKAAQLSDLHLFELYQIIF